MKSADIKVGQFYTNGKGQARKVLSIKDRVLGQKQVEWCDANYKCVRNYKDYGSKWGEMLLQSFAAWAKSTVEEEGRHEIQGRR